MAGRGGGGPVRRRRQLDKAEAGNGRRRHPSASTMEAARRRGSPRNRYGVAKVRWPLRAVWSAAEADAPRPARVPHPARPPHLLCIYRAAQPAQPGDAGMLTTTAVDIYLRRHMPQHATHERRRRGAGDARLFIICHNGHKNSSRAKAACRLICGILPG